MKSRLLWKLLGINILVIGVVILIVWLAIDYLASDYFMTLMKEYNSSPAAVHRMYLDATHRSLIWASLATLALAVILSFLLTRKVLNPLSQMTGITRKIASGDYRPACRSLPTTRPASWPPLSIRWRTASRGSNN